MAGVERLPGHKDVDPNCYESESAKIFATAITEALAANTFVFDASDLMPVAVGSSAGQGTFWQAMNDWSQGTSAADVTAEVESAWPA